MIKPHHEFPMAFRSRLAQVIEMGDRPQRAWGLLFMFLEKRVVEGLIDEPGAPVPAN